VIRRRLRFVLMAGAVVVLAFPAAGVSAGGSVQQDTEASLINLAVPSADPCVFTDARVDVVDLLHQGQPTTLTYSIFVSNVCTNENLASVGQLATDTLDDSQFSAAPALKGADLNATVMGFAGPGCLGQV
jgi:hypothetical protein